MNNAANDADIKNGSELAKKYGIKITLPKFGYSGSEYTFNKEEKVIAKGVSSVKYISALIADELYELSQHQKYTHFIDVLYDIARFTSADSRQVDVLIKIDYFSGYGNQRELLRICDIFEMFKRGDIKQMKKESINEPEIEKIIQKYSTDKTKSGAEAKSYTLLDVRSIMRECEDLVKGVGMPDLSDIVKVKNFNDIMGYTGYASGKENDRRKLFVKEIYPLKRKKDGAQFGYSIITHSIGSGVEGRFTVFNRVFNKDPINKEDIILCTGYERDGVYFELTSYTHVI